MLFESIAIEEYCPTSFVESIVAQLHVPFDAVLLQYFRSKLEVASYSEIWILLLESMAIEEYSPRFPVDRKSAVAQLQAPFEAVLLQYLKLFRLRLLTKLYSEI